VDQLKQRLDAGENIYLLDVRTPAELAEHGLIAGAVNIPIDELESRLAEVPKDRPVVTYCMRGGRAERASELLQKDGHQGVQHGGIIEWKEKGLSRGAAVRRRRAKPEPTIDGRQPGSGGCPLVPQRLARFEDVLDPLLGSLFAAEAQEGFLLETQHVLFGNETRL
jgi:rhodanese-related sulfurtransferase